MMKILAIDTSTMFGGIALMDESSGMIAEYRFNLKSTYSERLIMEIDHTLKHAALTLSDIALFAIAIGPGSFTGLRIGLSTVKGFSYATGNPIVSVPTLEALAWNFPYSRYPVCTMLNARKKEAYAALFQWDNNGFIRLIDEVSIKVNELLGKVKLLTHEFVIFTGEGAFLYRDKIIEGMGGKAILASHEKMTPSPANVAFLGLQKARGGTFSEPISLVPFYIRRSEAEIKDSEE